MPAISKNVGLYLAEAGAYCLDAQGHSSGVVMEVEGMVEEPVQLFWGEQIDGQVQRTWSDTQEATEYGATAIAILLLQLFTEYTIIERSFKGTGFDYWLGSGEYDENLLPFEQQTARLEISGIWKESPTNTLRARVLRKEKQVEAGGYGTLPAVIIVVEFGNPKAKLRII